MALIGQDRAVSRPLPRWSAVVVGAAAVGVLLASSATAVLADLSQSSGASTAAPSAPRPSSDKRVRARLPELTAFVEKERGLAMRRPVDVEVLDDEEFLEALNEGGEFVEGPDVGATFTALGLVPVDEDVEAEAEAETEEYYDDGTVGFYDTTTERLVVRGDTFGPYEEMVLVHELTHALQDQWFKTDRPELYDGSETWIAFNALIEGDATRVEQTWYLAQTSKVQRKIDEEEYDTFADLDDVDEVEDEADAAGAPASAPFDGDAEEDDFDVYAATGSFPYDAGVVMVEALLEKGGQKLLDATFRVPPTTTEQVLHPELIGAGSPLVPPAPAPDGVVVDEGVLGELGLAMMLRNDPMKGGAQVGWEGDAYVTYESGEQVCTLANVLMSNAATRDGLVAALRKRQTYATPRGDTGLLLKSCA